MIKFKVGDEVKVLGTDIACGYKGNIKGGSLATVTKVNEESGSVKCNDEGESCWINKKQVELVQSKYPNPPHVHADLIIEWAKGANIEMLNDFTEYWVAMISPTFKQGNVYRVAPTQSELADIKTQAKIDKHQSKIDALKLTLSNGGE